MGLLEDDLILVRRQSRSKAGRGGGGRGKPRPEPSLGFRGNGKAGQRGHFRTSRYE